MPATTTAATAGRGSPARARAVVCVSDDTLRRPVRHALERDGFDVLVEVDRGIEILPAVAEYEPDVVVLDVALLGSLGVRLLRLITTLAPDVAIVALAPMHTLDLAVLEAGAHVVVPADDLRKLSEALSELAALRTAARGDAS